MNSDLSTISPPLTSLLLGLIMLPMEAILFATLVAATILSLVPHLLDRGFPVEIPTDSYVEGGVTLTPFLVVAPHLALFAKFATVWVISPLIATTATTSPLETPLSSRRPISRLLPMVLTPIGIQTLVRHIMSHLT